MNNWDSCKIQHDQTILEAVKIIDTGGAKIAVVVDEDCKLLGTITDYDVRQAILKGHDLRKNVTSIMNHNPKVVNISCSDQEILAKMKSKSVRQIPIVNDNGFLVGLKLLSDFSNESIKRSNIVVIMAGGLGTRLRPLTDHCPKPLLKIGNKPILEIILESFIEAGFCKFYISVNYKAEMIKQYFGNGYKYGVTINYLEENKRLGTAGALSLLPDQIKESVIVMNGDLLTKVSFKQLLDFHTNNKSLATMCVREYNYQIPYGVIDFDNWKITALKEKPVYSAFVNAGIYVLEPEVIKSIEKEKYFDMTDLFSDVMSKKENALIFPIREYWLDVGRIEDFEKAQGEF